MPRKTAAIAIAAFGLAVLVWAAFTFRRPIEREWRLWQFARAEGEAKTAIADRLVALGAAEPVEDWYLGLLRSEDGAARATGVAGLGAMRSERAVAALIALLAREVAPSGRAAVDPGHIFGALERVDTAAARAFVADVRASRMVSQMNVFKALGSLSPEIGGSVLNEILRAPDASAELKLRAIEFIRMPPAAETAPALVEILRDRSRGAAAVRGRAARALLRLEGRPLDRLDGPLAADEGALVGALGDPNGAVRQAAATVLGKLGGLSARARAALAGVAVDDTGFLVRHAAARSLARHGPLPDRVVTKLLDDVAGRYAAASSARFVLREAGLGE